MAYSKTITIKLEVKKWLTKETTKRWHELAEARHSKNYMNSPDLKRTTSLFGRNRSDLRLVAGYLTGHGSFRMHLRRLQLTADTSCRFCGLEEETAEHILCECKRHQILGKGFPTITDYNNFNLDILLKYINFIIGL